MSGFSSKNVKSVESLLLFIYLSRRVSLKIGTKKIQSVENLLLFFYVKELSVESLLLFSCPINRDFCAYQNNMHKND